MPAYGSKPLWRRFFASNRGFGETWGTGNCRSFCVFLFLSFPIQTMFPNNYYFHPLPDFQVDKYRKHLAELCMKGSSTPFVELLPVAAQTNLDFIKNIPWVVEAREHFEIAANLDQNAEFQAHVSKTMPTILASISHMPLGRFWHCL